MAVVREVQGTATQRLDLFPVLDLPVLALSSLGVQVRAEAEPGVEIHAVVHDVVLDVQEIAGPVPAAGLGLV